MARMFARPGKIVTLMVAVLVVLVISIAVVSTGSADNKISLGLPPEISTGDTSADAESVQQTLLSTDNNEIITERTSDKRVWEIVRKYQTIDTQTKKVSVEDKVSHIVEVGTGICYQDETGQYHPADVRWQQDQIGYYIIKAGYQLRVGKAAGEWVTYTVNKKTAYLRPSGIYLKSDHNSILAQINLYSQGTIDPGDPTKLVYKDAFGPGIDLEYSANPSGYHQNVVFREPMSSPEALSDSKIAVYTEMSTDKGALDDELEITIPDKKSFHKFSELSETQATEGDIGFCITSRKNGEDVQETWWQFGKSEVFDNSGHLGGNTTCAAKQMVRERDGRTYLVETLDGKYFQEAVYPIAWDYQTVSGTITSNTTWYANNTYYVSSYLTLSNSAELKIEPGTVVKFNTGMCYINCAGTGKITAIGEPYLPIVFTSKNDDKNGEIITGSTGQPAAGSYYRAFVGEASRINFAFCRFLYASNGVQITAYSGTPNPIRNNIFTYSSTGISYQGAGKIENNLFSSCGTGIGVQGNGTLVQNNTADGCQTGISNAGSSSLTIRNNLITNCTCGFSSRDTYYVLDHNGYWSNTTNFFGAQMGTYDIQLTASPYHVASSTFNGLGEYYLNNDPNGGECLKDGGSYSITNTNSCYKDDPNAWSIYHVPSDGVHGFSSDTTLSENTVWQPNYDTCDTGTVAIGYHHPRVDYLIDSATVTIDQNSLEILPGTVSVLNAESNESCLNAINGGNHRWHGNPFAGGYITFVDCGRVTEVSTINNPNYCTWISVFEGTVALEFCKYYGITEGFEVDDSVLNMHDCIFALNPTGLSSYYSQFKVENSLFYGNGRGFYLWGSGEVFNVTFDRNNQGIVLSPYEDQSQLNLQNSLFSNNSIGIDESSYNSTIQLTEDHNIYYQNTVHMDSALGSLSSTDWADPNTANSILLNGNPYTSSWTQFSDRFRLTATTYAVNGGYDPNNQGMWGYTTQTINTSDVSPKDIGYHYPLSADTDSEGLYDYEEYWLGTDPNNPDTDSDELTDYQEVRTYYTNPLNMDSDGDGMPDGWEVQYGLNPLSNADASTDADQDGLSNLQEYTYGINPLLADTDNDGMPDKWEIDNNFNPDNAADAEQDADNDGLTNLGEYTAQANPYAADSDNDGMPDGWEVNHGLNPLSSSDKTTDFDEDGHNNYVEYLHDSNPNDSNSLPATTTTITVPGIASSIQQAIDWSINGDVVVVLKGEYKENINFNGKAITLRGTDCYDWNAIAQTVIIAQNANSDVVTFASGETNSSILTGLMIVKGNYGIQCTNSSSPVINNCIIEANSSHEIFVESGSPIIKNNMIGADISSTNGSGIYSSSSSALVIENNIIYKNKADGILFDQLSGGGVIQNNTIVANSGNGINTHPNAAVPQVFNCLLWNNIGLDLNGCAATYSCVEDSACIGNPVITHNISGNPIFIDSNVNDYRIDRDSPCIDMGDPNTTVSGSAKDIENEPRFARTIDIGADEVCEVYNTTSDTWYRSIQTAIDNASNNDVIKVCEWEYTESLTFPGLRIMLTGTDPNNWKSVESTIINPANSNVNAVTFNSGEDPNCIIRGFTISGGNHGIYCNGSSPTITQCQVQNNAADGVYCLSGSPLIWGNKISSNAGNGIDSVSMTSPSIEVNIIHDNDSSGINIANSAVSSGIYNNTIVNNMTGISVDPNSDVPDIRNCILWQNVSSDLSGCLAVYSCLTDPNDIGDPNTSHNISQYPQFFDEERSDFHISSSSPCMAMGDPNTLVSSNIDIDSQPLAATENVYAMGADSVAIRYVNMNATTGGSGTSWLQAYNSLQNAINDQSAQELWVAQGTYTPASRGNSFVLRSGLSIYGGFSGLGNETIKEQRNFNINKTILSGDLPNTTNDCYHVVRGANNAKLDGFIIEKGSASDSIENSGAGMINLGCSPTVENCIFQNNTVSGDGGAIFNYGHGSEAKINQCTFISNTAGVRGGAILMTCSPKFDPSDVRG